MSRFTQRIINYNDYIILFVLNAAEMVLELAASRIMSPFFGNSNFVWTAIIGIILFAGSLGNLIGGRISSLKSSRGVAALLLLFASIYIAMIPLMNESVLQGIEDGNMGIQFSSVMGSIVLFLIPSTLLGTITPIIMKERIGDGEDKGRESGRITAFIALGSLIGTFLGGFFLIPSIGTKGIFVLLSFVVMIFVPLMRPLKNIDNKKFRLFFVSVFLITIIVSVISLICVNNGNNDEQISIDTEYGRVIIEDTVSRDGKIRYYKQSGAYSSATYLDPKKKYDLVFEYLKRYDDMFDYTDVKDVAMIGGAAYQYPKYFISHYPDKTMDVIEIDPMSTEIAKKYFFLDDLIKDYGEERLGLYNEDGRVFLANTDKKYDVILNDAFSGEVPVGTLATKEAAQIIKSALNPDGVYMSNVLGAVSGIKSKFLKAEVKTMKKVFKNVYVIPVHKNAMPDKYINWMVVATDNNSYKPEKVMDLNMSNAIVLTDDYNPIDELVSTGYHD